jgi:glucose-6-phosphate 1-dehydrogenase
MRTRVVIFGVSGDLARRKLLPALSELVDSGSHADLSIVGVSRRSITVDEVAHDFPLLASRMSMFVMDLANPEEYERLARELRIGRDEQVLFYLAVPPGAAADIVDFLGQAALSLPNIKILFEKPFGFDLESAQEFIERTKRYFNERQIYRIDHYMAKEVASRLIALREDAEGHHHSWGGHSVASVRVEATETIGIEKRGSYDAVGALRDIVQGHLMQLLSLVLLHPMGDEPLSKKRLAALQSLRPADVALAARAQYEDYATEIENPGSLTETYAHLTLASDDPQWQGVPLQLVTGKKLDRKRTAVTVTYRDGTSEIFEEEAALKDARIPDAYERVLEDAIAGDQTIFTTSDEVIASWRLLAPLQQSWAMEDAIPIYPVGNSAEDVYDTIFSGKASEKPL